MGNFNIVRDTELREKKITIRVTKTEKEFLECYAKIKGFRTISDCIRHLIKKEKEFLDDFANFDGYKDIVDYINHLEAEEIARLAKERNNNIK